MNVEEYMAKSGLTDEDVERMAAPYEEEGAERPAPVGPVYTGAHIDAVGKRRMTVVYDARDTKRAEALARRRGVKPSQVYRDALHSYLDAEAV